MKSFDELEAEDIYKFAEAIFPLNRSLTGIGARETLKQIQRLIPELKIQEVKSGTKVYDWIIPKEWNIEDAYIISPNGEKICDYTQSNLHLVGYSTPIEKKISLEELQLHLYSIPEQPDAIPYVTSYYDENWGFCISQNERNKLVEGEYKVLIKGRKFNGVLNYADVVLQGKSKKEIIFSTYICHPSMANNEVSGITVSTFLAKWIAGLNDRYYTYRFIFVPETIGSLLYIKNNFKHLKKNTIAGFNITCIGDERAYSFLPSRNGDTIADRVALHVLNKIDPYFKTYTWSDRGSDERQYCAPGIDLPVASIMRSKYGEYPEYHTSLDQLGNVVTKKGLEGGLKVLQEIVLSLESNYFPMLKTVGEPQLSKRDLYPKTSIKSSQQEARLFLNLTTWSDGTKSLLDIAEILGVYVLDIIPYIKILEGKKLLKLNRQSIKNPLKF